MAASKNVFNNPCSSLLALQLMEWEEIQKAAKSAYIDIDCKKEKKNKQKTLKFHYYILGWWIDEVR